MATTRVPYKGKKELTMAQFEAIPLLDNATDYDIVDYPNTGITNAQMTAALGYTRLFNAGDTFVCVDSGTYKQGHAYKIAVNGDTKSWVDITPAGSMGSVQSMTYDNTSLEEHINEILGFVNTENGGNLVNICFKTSEAITGTMLTSTQSLSTNALTNSSSTVSIVGAGELVCLTLGTVRSGSTSGVKAIFNCANDTNTCSFANIMMTNISGTINAEISGHEINVTSASGIINNYFQAVSILSTPLEHLVINYFTI